MWIGTRSLLIADESRYPRGEHAHEFGRRSFGEMNPESCHSTGTIGEVESWYRLWRLCEKLRESRPGTVGGYHPGCEWDCTLRRSVLSIARGLC
jgi:hypothetical protein